MNEQVTLIFPKKISNVIPTLLFYLVDVPNELNLSPLSKEDFLDDQIVSSKLECIEFLQLQPFVSNALYSTNILIHLLVSSRLSSLLLKSYLSHLLHVNNVFFLYVCYF